MKIKTNDFVEFLNYLKQIIRITKFKNGKNRRFLLYKRELPTKDAVADRVQHYKEFQHLPSSELLNKQAARCMNCRNSLSV